MIDIITFLVHRSPGLKRKLKVAGRNESPDQFVSKVLSSTILYAFMLALIFYMFFNTIANNMFTKILLFIFLFAALTVVCYRYLSLGLDASIKRREGDINKEVIFAGRFLLVKLESGMPLFNALIEGSKSYGVSAKYFKEIVDQINLGTPIEDAIDDTMRTTPSKKFKKILFQINTALKLGIDVTSSLRSILKELVAEQNSEIKRYGNKLNSVAMFYMLLAIVVPSLGMTVFVIIISFMSLDLGLPGYSFICMILLIIQLVFMSVFKGIRPNVNL